MHHCGILHNDLFKDNIMLHFLVDKLDVYIIVYDWGEIGICKRYGFAKEQDFTNTQKCVGRLPHNCFLFTMNQ